MVEEASDARVSAIDGEKILAQVIGSDGNEIDHLGKMREDGDYGWDLGHDADGRLVDRIAFFIELSDGIADDFDKVFEGLVETIEKSSMGSMLAMVGGRKALEPLREPVAEKMTDLIEDLVKDGDGTDGDFIETFTVRIEHIIDQRLARARLL